MSLSRNRALLIAAKVGLGAEELSKPCDDRLFPLLANFVHPWRLVFSSLLSEVDLDDVMEENQSRSEEEKRVAALRKWKARKGHEATYSVLVEAALDRGNLDQAERICHQLLALQPKAPTETKSCEIPNSSSTQRSPLPPRPSPTPPLSSTTPPTETLSPVATFLEEKIKQLDEEYTKIERLVLQTIKLRAAPHVSDNSDNLAEEDDCIGSLRLADAQQPSHITRLNCKSAYILGFISIMILALAAYFGDKQYYSNYESPTLPLLQNLDGLRILQEIRADYRKFGTAILNDQKGATIEGFEHDCNYQSDCINHKIAIKWLNGHKEFQDATWSALISVLCQIEKRNLAVQISNKLQISYSHPY